MKNAAMILGILGGLVGMVVGFFGYGFTVFIDMFGEIPKVAEQVEDPERLRFLSLVSPILAVAGGAMAIGRPYWAAPLLILSAVGMNWGFDFNVFTMFPIAMCGLAGVLALLGARDQRPYG
jgi:hypothetical protein